MMINFCIIHVDIKADWCFRWFWAVFNFVRVIFGTFLRFFYVIIWVFQIGKPVNEFLFSWVFFLLRFFISLVLKITFLLFIIDFQSIWVCFFLNIQNRDFIVKIFGRWQTCTHLSLLRYYYWFGNWFFVYEVSIDWLRSTLTVFAWLNSA